MSNQRPQPVAAVGPTVARSVDRAYAPSSESREPIVDVRTALFTVADGGLFLALQPTLAGERLPCEDPTPDESLDAVARRIILGATGAPAQYLEQLYTLSVRETPDWTLIVSYLGLACSEGSPPPAAPARWIDLATAPPLSVADAMVVDYALMRLRAKIGYTNVAFFLLPPRFTLSQLQSVYETILGRPLDKRNFRRRVTASGMLERTEEQRREGSHRPAALFRFRAQHDPERYLTPSWAEDA